MCVPADQQHQIFDLIRNVFLIPAFLKNEIHYDKLFSLILEIILLTITRTLLEYSHL